MSLVICKLCPYMVDSDIVEVVKWLKNGEVICERHDLDEDELDEYEGIDDED